MKPKKQPKPEKLTQEQLNRLVFEKIAKKLKEKKEVRINLSRLRIK